MSINMNNSVSNIIATENIKLFVELIQSQEVKSHIPAHWYRNHATMFGANTMVGISSAIFNMPIETLCCIDEGAASDPFLPLEFIPNSVFDTVRRNVTIAEEKQKVQEKIDLSNLDLERKLAATNTLTYVCVVMASLARIVRQNLTHDIALFEQGLSFKGIQVVFERYVIIANKVYMYMQTNNIEGTQSDLVGILPPTVIDNGALYCEYDLAEMI